jgi:hypothetical protein
MGMMELHGRARERRVPGDLLFSLVSHQKHTKHKEHDEENSI